MKIGILTQPLEVNYGGILQAYALQTILKRMGHEVTTINRCGNNGTLYFFLQVLGRFYITFLKKKKKLLFSRYYTKANAAKIRKNSEIFIQKHITTSSRLYSNNALRRYIKSRSFDAFIVGSDQVWRPCYSPDMSTYFLDFLEDKTAVKRIAYAASFGVDNWEFTEKQTKQCAALIQKFDAISVREDSGIDLCKQYLNRIDGIQVLDPTLLLNASEYIKLVEQANIVKSDGNLMTYILDASEEKQEMIDRIAQEKGLNPFSVIAKNNYYSSLAPMEDCVQPPIEKWLRGFMDADFVLADSFHGCVFAIIFNKPFIAIGNKERGMSRFNSLLNLFGLTDRLIYSFEDITTDLLNKPIDWERVNKKRKEQQQVSISYLRNNLES